MHCSPNFPFTSTQRARMSDSKDQQIKPMWANLSHHLEEPCKAYMKPQSQTCIENNLFAYPHKLSTHKSIGLSSTAPMTDGMLYCLSRIGEYIVRFWKNTLSYTPPAGFKITHEACLTLLSVMRT